MVYVLYVRFLLCLLLCHMMWTKTGLFIVFGRFLVVWCSLMFKNPFLVFWQSLRFGLDYRMFMNWRTTVLEQTE